VEPNSSADPHDISTAKGGYRIPFDAIDMGTIGSGNHLKWLGLKFRSAISGFLGKPDIGCLLHSVSAANLATTPGRY
jgi:hypothetical protein